MTAELGKEDLVGPSTDQERRAIEGETTTQDREGTTAAEGTRGGETAPAGSQRARPAVADFQAALAQAKEDVAAKEERDGRAATKARKDEGRVVIVKARKPKKGGNERNRATKQAIREDEMPLMNEARQIQAGKHRLDVSKERPTN